MTVTLHLLLIHL
uniref:Uncharacterized protein n=1 Tax=Arundo donax TaxID=35708 RepID=A0A0A9CA44_ARUDO